MFNQHQESQLKAPLDPRLIYKAQGYEYVPSHIVIDTANRIFGPGAWSTDVVEHKPLGEPTERSQGNGKSGWSVAWYALVRVTVRGADGTTTSFTDTTVSNAFGPNLADIHDLAAKSSISGAEKRALRHFGPQFGLGLYGELPPADYSPVPAAKPQGQPLAVEAKAPRPRGVAEIAAVVSTAKASPPHAPASLGRDDKPQWMAARARIVAHCATVDVAGGMVGLVMEAAGGGQDPALRTGAQLEGFATKWETLDTVSAAAKCGEWIKLYRGGKA